MRSWSRSYDYQWCPREWEEVKKKQKEAGDGAAISAKAAVFSIYQTVIFSQEGKTEVEVLNFRIISQSAHCAKKESETVS